MMFFAILLLSSNLHAKHESKHRDRELNPEYGYRALKIIEQLMPNDVVGKENLVRIGHATDGGYTLLDNFGNVTCAYSIGIGGDWSFDLEIASRGMKVYMFDHSINEPILNNSLLKFYKYGVNYVDKPEARLLSLESMLKLDNNSEQTNMILKMDVEGYEWEVIAHSSILKQFSQITMELHWFKKVIVSKDEYLVAIKALENLNKTHQLVWVHGITAYWVPSTNVNFGGVPLPDQIEVTFVRRDEDLKFVKHNNKKRRMDERNFIPGTETLIWWVEGGGDIDFEGLQNAYKKMIPENMKVSPQKQ